jgi:ankyrin repeat protein
MSLKLAKAALIAICVGGDANDMAEFLKSNRKIKVNNIVKGETPFGLAVRYGNFEVAKFLMTGDVNKHNKSGDTPLHTAACCGHEEIIKLLLGHKEIQVNAVNSDNKTPLYLAASHGLETTIEALLSHPDIDVNRPDQCDRTPLYVAARNGFAGTVKLLLGHKNCDVNKPAGSGKTPLYFATERVDADADVYKIVKMLVSHPDIDVNKPGGEHNATPLYNMAWGQKQIVELILSCKKDVDTQYKIAGKSTAKEIAIFRGTTDIAPLIDEYETCPKSCRHRLRAKLGFAEQDSVDLFALVTLINEGLLQCTGDKQQKAKRFFHVISKLPLELQMLLCNHTYSVKKDFVSSQPLQKSLQNLIASLL